MPTILEHNLDELQAALEAIRESLGEVLRPLGRFAGVTTGERSVNAYMREAKGEGPRRLGDGGPLRMDKAPLAVCRRSPLRGCCTDTALCNVVPMRLWRAQSGRPG